MHRIHIYIYVKYIYINMYHIIYIYIRLYIYIYYFLAYLCKSCPNVQHATRDSENLEYSGKYVKRDLHNVKIIYKRNLQICPPYSRVPALVAQHARRHAPFRESGVIQEACQKRLL